MPADSTKYFKTIVPRYDNGAMFLGYKVPAAQTFTSYAPPSDEYAYVQTVTGLTGTQLRRFLQSKYATDFLNQGSTGRLDNATTYLGLPGYQSKASCQQDADCASGQVCFAFNERTFGAQQGPTCTPAIYPEILLGNKVNNGTPLRQYSNFCFTDDDCHGIDEITGKPKQGLSCNHFYKGPGMFSKNGLCQVKYEHNGRNYFLKTPPGWTFPLQSKLQQCQTQSDCGPTGIDGWTRCVGGANDGKKYCTWPGQTATPSPRQLTTAIPQGMAPQKPMPMLTTPSVPEARALNIEAQQFASMQAATGAFIGQKPKNPNSLISLSNQSHQNVRQQERQKDNPRVPQPLTNALTV